MDKDIDRIVKNPDTEIVIRIDDFGGKRGLTIREFIKGERYTGFTKAGTRIPADKFKQFKDAINSIDEAELMAEIVNSQLPGESKNVAPGQVKEAKKSKGKKISEIEEQEI